MLQRPSDWLGLDLAWGVRDSREDPWVRVRPSGPGGPWARESRGLGQGRVGSEGRSRDPWNSRGAARVQRTVVWGGTGVLVIRWVGGCGWGNTESKGNRHFFHSRPTLMKSLNRCAPRRKNDERSASPLRGGRSKRDGEPPPEQRTHSRASERA